MPAITWVEQGWESGPWGSVGIPGELEKELLGWCEEAKKPRLCVYNGRWGWVGSWASLMKGLRCLPKGHKAGLQGSLAGL